MAIISSVKSFSLKLSRKHRKSSSEDPNNGLTPLKPVVLPRVRPDHQVALAEQGWTTVGLDEKPTDALYDSYQELLQASQAFFDLPDDYKQTFKTQHGSEEGWSRVEGEKEFITLRTIQNTPDELKKAASKYWAEAGGLLNETLVRVAESLDLPAEALTVYSKPCATLGNEETATMLRLFRYEGFEGSQSKVVAEPHADLGLLSFVIGDKPGLEVMDNRANFWFPIEQSYEAPKGSLLVGRQLERLSNARYRAGGHRVKSNPNLSPDPKTSSDPESNWRHSIVFVMRAHLPVPINTDELTTKITGPFSKPLKGVTAGEFFDKIHSAHFNINTGVEEREEQRRRLAEQEEYSATGK
ncbi:Clavaminate synthase-like protein [Cadophora sp. DSE1049]|nr:Clavaminate synthase-like protein [Cadophora sp. DSE1049]